MSITMNAVREARAKTYTELVAVASAAAAENRNLTVDEQSKFDTLSTELRGLDERIEVLEHQERSEEEQRSMFSNPAASHPLYISAGTVEAVDQARRDGSSGLWTAREERAVITTATKGRPSGYVNGQVVGPRMLHVAAGVSTTHAPDNTRSEYGKYTWPAGVAGGVAENVSLAEFAAITSGSVVLKRYGRWTDFTLESSKGTDTSGMLTAHQIGIARDLDASLIGAVATDAGAARAFKADVTGHVRSVIAEVADTTAADDVDQLIIVAHPSDVGALTDITATGGRTLAEPFGRFAGVKIYPTATGTTAGVLHVANLGRATRFLTAEELTVRSHLDIKTGAASVASSIIAGYATNMLAGYVVGVDVVSP